MGIKIDKKDRKILSILDINARLPISQISKKVGLSQQVVDYRIKRLEKSGVIEGYYTLINHSKVGCMYATVTLKLRNINQEIKEKMIQYLYQKDNIGWLGSIRGYYDIGMVVFVRDFHFFKSELDKFIDLFSKYIDDREINFRTDLYFFDYKFLNNSFKYYVLGGKVSQSIDHSDDSILREISMNSRLKLLELSKKTKLSMKTLVKRIKLMEKKAIILNYKPILNLYKLNYLEFHLYLRFGKSSKEKRKAIFSYLKSNNNVHFIIESISSYDLEIEIHVNSEEELDIFKKKIYDLFSDDVRNIEVESTSKIHKINYYYGI